jgi:branched-chain amino acid transport system substrate-binding protein
VSGLHSPPLLANRDFINENKILTLDPWAAAGPITRPATEENWIFRLSVDDTKAGEVITQYAAKEDFKKPYLLLEDTGWGDSNLKTMSKAIKSTGGSLMGVSRFKWGVGNSESETIAVKIKNSGADVVFLVANANEARPLLKALMKNPDIKHLPIRSHWGIAGGSFAEDVPAVVKNLDLKFIQTKFSFFSGEETAVTEKAFSTAQKLFPEMIKKKEDIKAPTGFIHAYDLMLLLNEAAKSISWTGDVQQDRQALKLALERIKNPVQGLVKLYEQPFKPYLVSSPDAHEALGVDDLAMGQFDENGLIRLVN